jgi:hypothetical protein
MAKANKPNQLSEPITAKEVLQNEPEVKRNTGL